MLQRFVGSFALKVSASDRHEILDAWPHRRVSIQQKSRYDSLRLYERLGPESSNGFLPRLT